MYEALNMIKTENNKKPTESVGHLYKEQQQLMFGARFKGINSYYIHSVELCRRLTNRRSSDD